MFNQLTDKASHRGIILNTIDYQALAQEWVSSVCLNVLAPGELASHNNKLMVITILVIKSVSLQEENFLTNRYCSSQLHVHTGRIKI